jgi:hypothetical protein
VDKKFVSSAAEFIMAAFFRLVTDNWIFSSKNGLKIRKYAFVHCARLTLRKMMDAITWLATTVSSNFVGYVVIPIPGIITSFSILLDVGVNNSVLLILQTLSSDSVG